ncbi:Microtubule-Associated Protein 1A [Manis pentadactyla]|nr:Microtubule-Associated Protein 1A [Manis pentadactyla]
MTDTVAFNGGDRDAMLRTPKSITLGRTSRHSGDLPARQQRAAAKAVRADDYGLWEGVPAEGAEPTGPPSTAGWARPGTDPGMAEHEDLLSDKSCLPLMTNSGCDTDLTSQMGDGRLF